MAIKSHQRRSVIGRRFFAANLMTLLLTAVLAFLSFSLLIPVYFRQTAREELRAAGREILLALDQLQTLKGDTAGDRPKRLRILKTLQEIQVSGRAVNARMALVDAGGSIRLTNISDLEPEELTAVLAELDKRRSQSAYVYVKIPFESLEGAGGALYLFTKTEDVSGVSRGVFVVLAFSLAAGGLLAFGFSLWQQRRISGPLRILMAAVEGYERRSFRPVALDTGDELQTLAETFNQMGAGLQAADEQQTRLLQDISHELKTPLMSVQGYAEGIRDGVLEGEEAARSLEVIIDESQRLKRLVEDLLLLSRLENQESAYAFRECTLEEIARQAADAVGGYAREQGVRIRLLSEGAVRVSADPDRAVRCLINILGNGVRYAREEVLIRLQAQERSAEVLISDDGPGFTDGEADRVFDRFYKGEKGGAGIGLTIAMTIAKHHGWDLEARNSPAGGAEFILRIPWNNS